MTRWFALCLIVVMGVLGGGGCEDDPTQCVGMPPLCHSTCDPLGPVAVPTCVEGEWVCPDDIPGRPCPDSADEAL